MKEISLNDQWTFYALPDDAPEGFPEDHASLPCESVSLPHVFSRNGRPCRGRDRARPR